MTQSGHRWSAAEFIASAIIQFLATPKKPNSPKGGDGKPRVLASSEKPRMTSRRTQDRRAAQTGKWPRARCREPSAKSATSWGSLMNYSIKSLVLLTVVSLSFVTLMPGATTWAGPPDNKGCHPDHKEDPCGGDGGSSKPTYTVDWDMGNVTDGSPAPVSCVGSAVRGLSVNFPVNSCKIEIDEDDDYCVCAISVKNTKNLTSVMVFVHNPCVVDLCGDDSWNTLRLPATLEGGDHAFTISVDDLPNGAVLTKTHQLNKGTSLPENISVGVLVYTED